MKPLFPWLYRGPGETFLFGADPRCGGMTAKCALVQHHHILIHAPDAQSSLPGPGNLAHILQTHRLDICLPIVRMITARGLI